MTVDTQITVDEEHGFEVVSSNDSIMPEEDEGHDVVSGAPSHEPLVAEGDDNTGYDWHRRSMLQEEEDEEFVPKEYINDETLTFVDPEDFEHERLEKSCGADELLWTFKFRTDLYGYETAWALEEKLVAKNTWKTITYGPPNASKYHDNTVYRGAMCLPGDKMYKLTLSDTQNDGLCCNYGQGTYSYEIDGMLEYDSSQQKSFTDRASHIFYAGLPVPAIPGGRNNLCGQNEQQIGIEIETDNYGAENAWELKSLSTNRVISSKGLGSYGKNSKDKVNVCVPNGKYQFTLTDGVGDGICCGAQGNGKYMLYLDNQLMVYGSDFTYGKSVKHDIIVGYENQLATGMSQREKQYLQAHNWRRNKYHTRFGADYVPLKYDLSLAQDAQYWANQLLNDCHIDGIKHEPGVEQGENLAKNMGNANGAYGIQYPVENICRRWFEREETWSYPDNAHLTQGLWASAHYVGCAESTKTMSGGGKCHIQVCRYARAGNCNMGKYDANVGDNWKEPMLMKANPCGPPCPGPGCH